jgi:acetyl/propionyl-CoA carboxylase alpha subunit
MESGGVMTTPRVLAIANRGEIAIRIARTARRLGWTPVVLLGNPDLDSFAAREVGSVERIGPAGAEFDVELVIAAAQRAGASALHPGYGFLSERPELSRACAEAGMTFVGPSPDTLELCGDKIATRNAAEASGVPVLAASEPLPGEDPQGWSAAGAVIGYPLMAKVAGGGGGRGLRVASDPDALEGAIRSALREATASGAGARVYLERYLEGARHVEVQVAADGARAVALGDRDCSIQRRHQKVVEEAPAFGLSDDRRARLHQHAVNLAEAVRLQGLATVEFLLGSNGELAFLEVNPRLQVEHTVTEEVTGLDLVEVQLSLATGGSLPDHVAPVGHAVQARMYAEDPANAFAPSPGTIELLEFPNLPGLRVDAGYETGDTIPDAYDSLVAKLITHGADRQDALERLATALRDLSIAGVASNRPWLIALLRDPAFREARHDLATAASINTPLGAPPASALRTLASFVLLPTGETAWESSGPFRIVSPATAVFHGAEGDGWQARVEMHKREGRWQAVVPDDGRESAGIGLVPQEDAMEVTSADGRWFVRFGPLAREVTSAASNDGALRAPMPGTITSVNVKPGEHVTQGSVLVVMTAMKIEMTIAAPFDGVVSAVSCREGELVGSKQVLVTLTPDESDGSA